MFNLIAFCRQATSWFRQLRQSQSGTLLKRMLIWLMLGTIMLMSLLVLIFLILLSWLLIPFMIHRRRRSMQKSYADVDQPRQASRNESHHVIEGEVIQKEDT